LTDTTASTRPSSEGLQELPSSALIMGLYYGSAEVGSAERRRLAHIHALSQRRVWREDDCKDMAQWVAQHLGIGTYKARKLVDCAAAIEDLPRISDALESGVLSIDKVVELTRFATRYDQQKLITWARKVSPSRVKKRADEYCARDRDDNSYDRTRRYLRWMIDEDLVYLEAVLPSDVGLPVLEAIDIKAESLSRLPAEGLDSFDVVEQRRIDALCELVLDGAGGSGGSQAPVTEVIVHTRLHETGFGNGVNAQGVVLHPDTVERLTCDCRLRFVLTDESGNAAGIGRASRDVPWWLRQAVLKAYDFSCVFPGCDCRRYLDAHHVVHWSRGGRTDFDNLIPLCSRHHDLVHEHGWSVFRGTKGTVIWYRPDGREYLPGPEPPGPETTTVDPESSYQLTL
jgi:hypothetical protein